MIVITLRDILAIAIIITALIIWLIIWLVDKIKELKGGDKK